MRTAHTIRSAMFFICVAGLQAQTPAAELLSRALQNPTDERILHQVVAAFHDTKDPAALASLRELFQKVPQKSEQRDLAILLWVTLGQKDDLYFNALANNAQEAVTSDAPLPFFLDPEGNPIRGDAPLAFTNWCKAHQLDSGPCLMTIAEQAVDVYYLALLKDRRAIPIFRQGLKSDNHAVVQSSVAGLGLLNDVDSIPLIEAAVRRLRPTQRPLIVSGLAQFDDRRVGPLLDEFIEDPRWRKDLDEKIRKRHAETVKQ